MVINTCGKSVGDIISNNGMFFKGFREPDSVKEINGIEMELDGWSSDVPVLSARVEMLKAEGYNIYLQHFKGQIAIWKWKD